MESKYAGMSSYNYSFNNPIMVSDPNGADPKDGEIPATVARRNNTKKEYDFLTGKVTNAFQTDTVIKGKKASKSNVSVDPNALATYSVTVSDAGSSGSGGLYSDTPDSPLRIRSMGGLKMIGGGLEAVGGGVSGVLTSETGVGVAVGYAIIVHGSDVAASGFTQMITGEYQETFTKQVLGYSLEAAGMDPKSASYYAGWGDAYLSVAGSGNLANIVDNTAVNFQKVITAENAVKMTSQEALISSNRIALANVENNMLKINLSNFAGDAYESFLIQKLGGSGSFKAGGLQFDGAYSNGNIWIEAKSGAFWENVAMKDIPMWKSKFGSKNSVAFNNIKHFEVYSSGPIPQVFKDFFTQKGIKFFDNFK